MLNQIHICANTFAAFIPEMIPLVTIVQFPISKRSKIAFSLQAVNQGDTYDKEVSAAETSTTFTDLFPGERYEVTVEAVSGATSSEPMTQQVVTRE